MRYIDLRSAFINGYVKPSRIDYYNACETVEDQTDKESSQERKATVGELNRFLRALEYTPEEIGSLSLQEVFEEIAALGEDYNALKENVQNQIKINRGRVQSVSVYEITERELSILEIGPQSSIFLNFAIFLLSVSISFLIALFTTTIASERTFAIFVVITAVGLVAGMVLLAVWYRGHRSVSDTIVKIKGRISSD